MNIKNGNVQQKSKSKCSLRYISNVIKNISILCSCMGISLFGGIFYGLTDILKYGSICLMNQCAYYLVIAAVTFFFLSTILSKFSKDYSEQADSVSYQANVSGRVLLQSSRAKNINSKVSKQTIAILKSTEGDKKTKQDTTTENIKYKIMQFFGTTKQDKVSLETSPLANLSKNVTLSGAPKEDEFNKRTLLSLPSPKTSQHTFTSKKAEASSKTLTSNTISKTEKCSALPQKGEICARTSPKHISSTIQKPTGKSKQNEIGPKTFSPKTSQNSNEKLHYSDQQLVPYKVQLECPVPEKNMPVVRKVPFNQNSMPEKSETNSRASTSNALSIALKLDAKPQEAEFRNSSPSILQPTGTPKQRKVCPGAFNPKTTFSDKVSNADKNGNTCDSHIYNPASEEKFPGGTNVPFHQNFKLKSSASGYTPITDILPYTDNYLFPYDPQLFGSSMPVQKMPGGPNVPFCQKFMPQYASGCTPVAELVATKKLTFFKGSIAQSQEEFKVQRTKFFPYPEGGICSLNFDCPSNQSAKLSPSSHRDSDQNKVSDMRTKFESMNMY